MITPGRVHEINVARNLRFTPHSIIAIDREYIDYGLFANWTEQNVWFITRFKSNTDYKTIYQTPMDTMPDHMLADELILFKGVKAKKTCPYRMRRIVVLYPKTNKETELLTNNLTLDRQTIADIYKDRWQIEIFFKALKQNLKINTFVGTTMNAILIQIWTA